MKKFADAHVHIKDSDFDAVKNMLDMLVSIGVTDTILLALCAQPDYDIVQNLSAMYWKKNYEKLNIASFGSLHQTDIYKDIPFEKQVEFLLDMGIDGIKLIEMKPDMRKLLKSGINDEKYDKMFKLLEERNTPVLFHANDPEEFWDLQKIAPGHIERGWFYGDGTYLSKQEIYNEVFEMLDKHPKLNVVFAHFFFISNDIDEAIRIMEKYPNVKFDLTPGSEMFLGFSKNIDAWHDFFEKYSDRILFGTDTNDNKKLESCAGLNKMIQMALSHDKTEFEMPVWPRYKIKGLNLSEETIEKICYKNYYEFAGKNIKKVDDDKFYSAAEKLLSDVKNTKGCYLNKDKVIKWLEKVLKERK